MNRSLPRALLGLGILLVLLGHASWLYRIPLVEHLDAIAYDAKVRLTLSDRVDTRIAILDIDEKSLAAEGRWPWGRDKMAALMDRLFDHYGIRLAGFDVVFAEPDRSSGLDTLETLAKGPLKSVPAFHSSLRELRPQLDYDARFASALRGRPVILGYYFSSQDEGASAGVLPAPTFPAGSFDDRPVAFTSWAGFGGNLARFQEVAAGAGHFNPIIDFDGISRRVPMLAEHRGQFYESLSLAMVRALLGFPPVQPVFQGGGAAGYEDIEWLELRTPQGRRLRIPVDENVASLVPYRGERGSFPYFSMTDVLRGEVPKGELSGRIVIVGTSAPGLMDLRATPIDPAYPGVEIHANLVAGMLDGVVKYKPGYLLGADLLLVLIAGLLLIVFLPRFSPLKASLFAATLLAVVVAINLVLWQAEHVVMPLAAGVLAVVLLYALNMSWGYFAESRTKRQFAELFGQYVPPELVDEMAKNPEGYSMAGRKQELTVLFSDVRGFTTISEALQPDELAALMNEYLGTMTALVRHHRGTLDKYIGDAIMAFWGAPVDDPSHARNAVLTALAMQAALPGLNRHLKARGRPELSIGVGINTGPMTVGDMGSPVRKAYTVMGDAVNLGSRLESITKQYGVGIITGEATRAAVGDGFVFREVDRVRVKGKAEPVGIFEPVGEAASVLPEDVEEIELWNKALLAYRAQAWDRAESALARLESRQPRYLYQLYRKRIEHLRREPPGPGWDGVTTFETK